MPASKVFIGLPGYGRDWITSIVGTCPTSAPPGLTKSAKAATFKMSYATAKAAIDQAVPVFDEKNSEATYSYVKTFNGLTPKGSATSCVVSRTVWYQNERSFTERMNLVAQYRLGGAALWTLGMEDAGATTAMRNVALAIAPDIVTSQLTIQNSEANQVSYGDIFLLNGLLTFNDKSPVAELAVSIEMKRANEITWTKIAESTTDRDGAISVPITLAESAAFRMRTEGTWERAESVSNEQNVSVRPKITINHPSSIRRGDPIEVKGFVLPRTSGASVIIQRMIAGKWQNGATSSLTDFNGEFVLKASQSERGVITMRIQVGNGAQTFYSQEFSVVVR